LAERLSEEDRLLPGGYVYLKTTPPAAPGIVSRKPVPRSLKVFFTIAKSSLIEEIGVNYVKVRRSERLIDMTQYLLDHPHDLIPLTFFLCFCIRNTWCKDNTAGSTRNRF
jgi:hypothetical protein